MHPGAIIRANFDYLKIMRKGRDRPCEVEVFPLRAVEELDEWPEMDERWR